MWDFMTLLGDVLGGLVCRQVLSAGELYSSEGVDRLGETVHGGLNIADSIATRVLRQMCRAAERR